MAEQATKDDNSRSARFAQWRRRITVEPTIFFHTLALTLMMVVGQTFFVHRACRVHHGFDEEICDHIELHLDAKREVHRTVAVFQQWRSVAGQLVPVVVAPFLGAWSDKRGRKLPLLLGLFGRFIQSAMMAVNAAHADWPLEVIIYSSVLPGAFMGSAIAVQTSIWSYVADVTSVQDRTIRLTILHACLLVAVPTGVVLGNYLFQLCDQNFTILFLIESSLVFVAIIYSLIRLKWQTSPKQTPLSEVGYSKIFSDFFDRKHVVNTLKVFSKKRPRRQRAHLIMLFICALLYTLQRDERQFVYLFTQLKLDWNFYSFSQFRAFESLIDLVTMLAGVPLMSKVLKWHDTVLILVGSLSFILGRLFWIFVDNAAWMMYAGAAASGLSVILGPVIRSMVSKIVDSSERGVAFVVLSVCTFATTLVGAPMYAQLYSATIYSYPAAIFWLTILSKAVVSILVGIIHSSPHVSSPTLKTASGEEEKEEEKEAEEQDELMTKAVLRREKGDEQSASPLPRNSIVDEGKVAPIDKNIA